MSDLLNGFLVGFEEDIAIADEPDWNARARMKVLFRANNANRGVMEKHKIGFALAK